MSSVRMFFDRLDRKKSHLLTPSPAPHIPTATAVYGKTASLSVSRRREERGELAPGRGRYSQDLQATLKSYQIRCGHGGGGVEEDGWIIVNVLGSKVALLGTSE